jgi:hypothetical protein
LLGAKLQRACSELASIIEAWPAAIAGQRPLQQGASAMKRYGLLCWDGMPLHGFPAKPDGMQHCMAKRLFLNNDVGGIATASITLPSKLSLFLQQGL